MNEYKKEAAIRRDFRRGKVDANNSRQKRTGKKPWLFQCRFTGRLIERCIQISPEYKEYVLYDGEVSDFVKCTFHREWKTISKHKTEAAAKQSYEDYNRNGYHLRHNENWEYRFIHETEFRKEKRNA